MPQIAVQSFGAVAPIEKAGEAIKVLGFDALMWVGQAIQPIVLTVKAFVLMLCCGSAL